tara:strand:- start:1901 stop:2665 length:765 start_codon:yes stop_codon:yes gene_type:complete
VNKTNPTTTPLGKDLLIGTRPLIEAIESGKQIDKVLLQKGLKGNVSQELFPLLRKYNIQQQSVPIEKLNRITKKNHQGVIAFVSPVDFVSVEEVIARAYESGKDPLLLILDRITDVRNFGAIARTAECTGVQGIIIPSRGSAPVNFDALKTSAGALNHISICKEEKLKDSIEYLKNSGLSIVACSEKGKEIAYNSNLKGPLAIIMGSEENGVSPEYLKMCDKVVQLPMMGKIGSLNVSVAAGALLFEVIRQNNY